MTGLWRYIREKGWEPLVYTKFQVKAGLAAGQNMLQGLAQAAQCDLSCDLSVGDRLYDGSPFTCHASKLENDGTGIHRY